MIRGRFAPSPTGRLHLGNVRSALLGWLQCRAAGGEFLLRIEDLDPDRAKGEFTRLIHEDLRWLGLDWDGPVLVQSERAAVYEEALRRLAARGRIYPCWCSRAEVQRAAGAPHPGEEGPVYPGTCRPGSRASGGGGGTPSGSVSPSGVEGPTALDAPARNGRRPSLRFRVEPGEVTFTDALCGTVTQDVATQVGDFVVRRSDGVASYQLAVVVDDAASGVTRVLRGDDLLASTPRQLQLIQALGIGAPEYAHVPLLLGEDGKRLAKREGATTVAGLRDAGVRPEAVVGLLAKWSGLGDGRPVSARELVPGFRLDHVRREPTVVRDEELAALVQGGKR